MQIMHSADEGNNIKRIIPLSDEKSIEMDINFAAGNLFLSSCDNNYLFDGEFRYIDNEPEIDYYKKNDTGILNLGMESESKEGKDKYDRNLTFDSIDDLSENEWTLKLSRNIPISLKMELGAAEAELNFTGLSLANLQVESGASKIKMDFSAPNPIIMNELKVGAGVSKFKGYNLLNANFEKMKFDGGIGDYELYFEGNIERTMNITINVALGALTLYIPENLAFSINHDKSIFSSFKIDDSYNKDDDYYYSLNYDETKPHINLKIDAGFGSINVNLLKE